MEPALKQRLLGAAVIVALAIIIIPFLLDGSGTEPVSEVPLPPEPQQEQQGPLITDDRVPTPAQEPQSQIIDQYSPPPSAPEAATTEPSLPAAPTPAAPPQAAPEPPAQPAPPAPTPAPQSESQPTPPAEPAAPAAAPQAEAGLHTWVVQVGSFSQRDKATALRDRLRKQQFKAFVEAFKAANGQQLYRVRVGPVPERAEAERLQQTLETQEKLKGFVTQHP